MAEKKQTKTFRAEQQLAMLEELKGVAEKLGIQVRQEKLLREVGYRVRSGACRVHETDVVLLDRGLPLDTQIDILVDVLARQPVETMYLSPAARRLFDDRRESGAGTAG